MFINYEPCLCGDPECRRCFPKCPLQKYDVVLLKKTDEAPEQKADVLEVKNGVVTCRIWEEYRDKDDVDGLVEVPEDDVTLATLEDL